MQLTIPDYLPPTLNVLLRMHWSYRRFNQRVANDLVSAYAQLSGIPKARHRRRVSIHFESRRPPADPDARLKLLLDALVAAGLLVDDSPTWLELGAIVSIKGSVRRTTITLEDQS